MPVFLYRASTYEEAGLYKFQNKEYTLAGNYNIELYAPPAEKPEDTYGEIWIPIEKL